MRILITGSEGRIGKHLSKLLSNEGHQVFGIDLIPKYDPFNYARVDVRDINKVKAIPPQIIYNLAGCVSRIECEENPLYAYQSNVEAVMEIVRFAIKNGSRLIHFVLHQFHEKGYYPKGIQSNSELFHSTANEALIHIHNRFNDKSKNNCL